MTTRDRLQKQMHGILDPLVRLLIRLGMTANAVTTIGLFLNIIVAVVFIYGAEYGERGDFRYLTWGGILILFAGLFDMLDGQVARLGGMSSKFGALYDSVLDRYSELICFLGICYYLVAHHYFKSSLIAFIGLIGSIMVSYTRARAEGLGIPCKEGIMQRPERVITLGLSSIICGLVASNKGGSYKWYFFGTDGYAVETIAFFTLPLLIIAILANYTAIQRLNACKRYLKSYDEKNY
jgi:CDP-diacylglycerol---glycerol-3-phosphate 3-phosphatidyltransferase